MTIQKKILKLNHKKIIDIPILLICFDRPEELKKNIKLLLKYKVKNLYIVQDGYNGVNYKSKNGHKEVRKILEELIKKNKVNINYFKKNYGKRYGPPKAISWFFKNVEMGVIVEDDTLPSKSFLLMSEILLEEHKYDKEVFQICGSGVLSKNFGSLTYLSSIPFIHGWATWRNRWKLYSQKIGNLKDLYNNKNFNKNVKSFINKIYWLDIFKNYKEKKIKTWDYPLVYYSLINNYQCIKPSINLITNIGYREKNKLSFRKRYEINTFYHLKNIKTSFKIEKEDESWTYSVSPRYQFSLIRKFFKGSLI